MNERFRKALVAGLAVSLAWSLRGQFGHLKGAMIPGAILAFVLAGLSGKRGWHHSLGRALTLGALGFSLGGHMSYGKLFEAVSQAGSLGEVLKEFFLIFSTGVLWGGLGGTFLGFAFCEKKLGKSDFFLGLSLFLLWFVPLGILNLETLDRPLYALGLALIVFYNAAVKKSVNVRILTFHGMFGFGSAFFLSALLLHGGAQGLIPGPFRWWAYRDQILGFTGGFWIAYAAYGLAEPEEDDASVFGRLGLGIFISLIPFLCLLNVILFWHKKNLLPGFAAWLATAWSACLFLSLVALLRKAPAEAFRMPGLRRLALGAWFYAIPGISLLAIFKELAVFGPSAWQGAYTVFIFQNVILAPVAVRYFFRSLDSRDTCR